MGYLRNGVCEPIEAWEHVQIAKPSAGGIPGIGETGAQCANATDDDGDGFVNDGCPAVGVAGGSVPCPAAGIPFRAGLVPHRSTGINANRESLPKPPKGGGSVWAFASCFVAGAEALRSPGEPAEPLSLCRGIAEPLPRPRPTRRVGFSPTA
jgi:hypothetical protein